MTGKHERYLRVLSKLASLSTERFKIAAAIVLGDRMVSLGLNHSRRDPFQDRMNLHGASTHLHAEVSAIKNALRHLGPGHLARSTLYVCRMKRAGSGPKQPLVQAMARPCSGCQDFLRHYGIPTVVYTVDSGGYGVLRAPGAGSLEECDEALASGQAAAEPSAALSAEGLARAGLQSAPG